MRASPTGGGGGGGSLAMGAVWLEEENFLPFVYGHDL